MRGFFLWASICLHCVFSAACAGPQVENDALPGAVRDLYQQLQENPKAVELYPQYIDLQLRDGDIEGVEDSLHVCIENNRNDYRAWLVKASTERTLASLGISDGLVRAEQSLVRAHKLSQAPDQSAQALASFARETWMPDKEEAYLLESLERAPEDEHANIRKSLISFYFKQARYRDVQAMLEKLDESAARFSSIRLEVALKGASNALAALQAQGFVPEDVFLLLRLTSSLPAVEVEQVEPLFQEVLNRSEKPEYRFAALMGLWESAWIAQLSRSESETFPVGIEEIARRLDDLDAYHPDWIVRAYLMACATRDQGFKDMLETRMRSMGMPLPKPPGTTQQTIQVWRIDDLRRLGLLKEAYQEWRSFSENTPQLPEYLLPGWEMAFELQKYDEALEILHSLVDAETSAVQTMSWKTRIVAGEAQSVALEIDQILAEEERHHPELYWLRAVAELHHNKQ